MNYLFDFLVLALIIFCAWLGKRIGFVRSFFGFCGTLISFVVSSFLARPVAKWLCEIVFLPILEKVVADSVSEKVGQKLQDIDFANLPDSVHQLLNLFGTDAEADTRVAEVDGPEDAWCREFISDDTIRHGFIPSANGVATAEALAKIYASITTGVDNIRLLKPETVENAAIVRRWWNDPLTPSWAKFGLGWALPYAPDTTAVFGHGGALGGEGFADRERGIAVAFLKNHITATHPVHPVRDELAEALGMPCRHW
jgi:hypothetical protein